MTPKSLAIGCSALFAACLTLPSQAATIVYAFDSQSLTATSNGLSGDGVTAGNVTLGGGMEIGSTQIDELDVASFKLGATGNLVFTITIPSTVTIDITNIAFAFDYESNNGSGSDYYAKWDLSLSQGSASKTTGSVGPYTPGVKVITSAEDFTLNGLTGLSDTTVTFTLAGDNGVNTSYTNGNANDRRTIFDDIVITANVATPVPEPSIALLCALGVLVIMRRKRT